MALLHSGQHAHLAVAGARFGKEQQARKEGFLKYFLALAIKKKDCCFSGLSLHLKREIKSKIDCLLSSAASPKFLHSRSSDCYDLWLSRV